MLSDHPSYQGACLIRPGHSKGQLKGGIYQVTDECCFQHGKGYPPHLDNMIFELFETQCEEDIVECLAKGGVRPEDVSTVVLR